MKTRVRIEPHIEQLDELDIISNDTDVVRDVLMESPSRRSKAKENVFEKREREENSTQEKFVKERSQKERPARGYTRTLAEKQSLETISKTILNKRATPRQGSLKKTELKQERNFWFFLRITSVCLLVISLGAAVYWLSEPVSKALDRPIKGVQVEGEFYFITKERATDLISNEINDDFLQVDLMRIKKAVLSDPWVENVTLTRQWPDTLVVRIAEQKPIARWGKGFLNQRGDIIPLAEDARLNMLPYLSGNESDAVEILQQYQDFSQLLRSRGLEIIALSCDSKKSWRLTLNNNIEIAIGRDHVMEKMQRFVAVYDVQLKNVWSDVHSIDVRYSNGIAVRWVAGSSAAKNSTAQQKKHLVTPAKAG